MLSDTLKQIRYCRKFNVLLANKQRC